MLCAGTDPESYITEYTLEYEGKPQTPNAGGLRFASASPVRGELDALREPRSHSGEGLGIQPRGGRRGEGGAQGGAGRGGGEGRAGGAGGEGFGSLASPLGSPGGRGGLGERAVSYERGTPGEGGDGAEARSASASSTGQPPCTLHPAPCTLNPGP